MYVLKAYLAVWLVLMAWAPGSALALSQAEASRQAKELYQKYVVDAAISTEAQLWLNQEMGRSLSLVAVRKPAWRGMSSTVVICSTKVSKHGECASRGDRTSPWLTPQEYVQEIWPSEQVVIDRISSLTATETLYIFYSLAQRTASQGHPQDPLLSPEDTPWNWIQDPVAGQSKPPQDGSDSSKAPSPATNPPDPSPPSPGYRNIYEPAVPLHDYAGQYYTLQLGVFDKRTEARRYTRTYGLDKTYIVQSRAGEKTVYQLYFGVFPTEEDVYAALEELPRVVIRQKPQLYSLAMVNTEADRYEQWRASKLEVLRDIQTRQEKP